MDNILANNLTMKQAIQIQSVHLYLQVSLLSKIVNHSGTHVMTVILYMAPHAHHDQHYWQNASTLHWP